MVGDYDGIPNTLSEIFEISNANRRLNKQKKRQKVQNGSSPATNPSLINLITNFYAQDLKNQRKAQEFVQGIKNMSDIDFLTQRLNR